jgi:tetratricopeptide (TPR) repeat protein
MTEGPVSIQTELKVARSYLGDAEQRLHAKADVIFELARRVYRDPVPIKITFAYGDFFGAPLTAEREKPPLDIGTKGEYREWMEEAASPIYRDLAAGIERLRQIAKRYRGAALIEGGEPKYGAGSLLAYGWLMLGDYYFYRCNWAQAAKMYRAAFKLEPSSQELLYRLGLTFVNDGDPARAHNFLERAIELAPDSDVAVEAHKQLERMATLGPAGKVFRGSPGVLKTLVVVSVVASVLCLLCVCCGLFGGFMEMSNDPDFATIWAVVFIAAGGLILIVPWAVTAIYYFVKRK